MGIRSSPERSLPATTGPSVKDASVFPSTAPVRRRLKMASTLETIANVYVKRGWRRVVSPDGSISFEKEARPSVLDRKTAKVLLSGRGRKFLRITGRKGGQRSTVDFEENSGV
jgi:hypothetical protein